MPCPQWGRMHMPYPFRNIFRNINLNTKTITCTYYVNSTVNKSLTILILILAGTVVLLGLGINKYQDEIQEFCGLDTQPITDALETLGPYLGEAKDKILAFLVFIRFSCSLVSTEPESE